MNLLFKLTDKDLGEDMVEMAKPRIRYAARGIVIRDDGKIAIFYKSNKNQYKLPGGGIENNENPKEAFLREVKEETGCIVEVVDEIGIVEEYRTKENFKQISYIYIGRVIKDTKKLDITIKEQEEGAMLIWKDLEDAKNTIRDCYYKLKASRYNTVYETKFTVLRDRKIIEFYLDKFLKK